MERETGNCVLESGFTDFTIYYRRNNAKSFLLSEFMDRIR